MLDPALAFILVLAIGIVAGIVFDRVAGPGWFARQFTGPRGYVTSALVGIAGAFIGYHVAGLIGLRGDVIALVVAALGAAAMLFLWRAMR
jgi:uncharacterized membrane protein YeaQ/YmgE (transglycosylase-associated protein family)